MNELNSNILLIDNQGLSHYTCYFAKGLAKHRQITLLGFSKKITMIPKHSRKKIYNFII